MRRGLVSICLFGLTGCAADPSVRYVEATSPAAVARAGDHLIDSFYLQRNDIRVELVKGAKPADQTMVVTNVREEDPAHRLMILRDDSMWTSTTISLTKAENSDLIDTAGVAVEDRRMELIQTIGSVAKIVVPMMGMASPGDVNEEDQHLLGCDLFPYSACDLPQPSELNVGAAAARRGPRGALQAFWGPVPPSAIPVAEFLAALGTRHVHGLYYAACRSLDVRFSPDESIDPDARIGSVNYHWKGKIADPRWVEFVRFPRKGNIRMHSQCGVSITSEADPTQSTAALLGAALSQAVAAKQAIDAPH